nr:zinc finger BED domain-containing protein RICESLEEPER 2-like [Tanacetum cinerariifolium]
MATQSSSTTTGVGSSSAQTVVKIIPTSQNPQIWKDYNLCQMSDNTTKAQSGQSSMSRDGSLFVYNLDVLREQLAGLVNQRGLPFNHFDDEQTTRVFQNHLQPKYNHDISTRWNFTYHMFQCGLKQRSTLMYFHDLLASKGLYNIYYAKYVNQTTTELSSGASSSRASGGNQMSLLLYRLKEHTNKKARSDPSLSSEYERYVHSDFVTHLENSEFATCDLLSFWKAKESIFSVLSRMAMDIISVQATSIASESAFSTSERVLSIRRTRLTAASLEMYFEEEFLDAEVQQYETILLSDEEIAIDAASSEDTMSGSGSGGKEVDYDMTTNYDDDY